MDEARGPPTRCRRAVSDSANAQKHEGKQPRVNALTRYQGLDSAIQSQWDRPSKAGFIQMHYDQCQIFALERLINYDFISRIEAQVYVQLEVGW